MGLHRGRVLAVAATAAALIVVGSTDVAQGAALSPKLGPVPNAVVARNLTRWRPPSISRLVRGVTHAHSVRARVKAIDRTLKALGVGVYKPNGKQVVGGFERGPDGIYLYDFEVRLLADQFKSRTMGSFNQLAAQFAKGKIKLKGRSMTGRHLAKAVAAGIKRLTRGSLRKNPGGALAAMVRALGQVRHVDLAHPPSPNKLVLDPLQRILIALDVVRSATGMVHVGHAQASAHAAGGSAPVAAPAAGCKSNSFSGGSSYGVAIAMMVVTGNPPGFILHEIFDGLDGVAIAYSVGVKAVKKELKGRFGINGPKSAKKMLFQVKVTMLDDYSKSPVIPCGRIPGYSLPKKGGIAGVPVVWTPDESGHLSYLGSIPKCGGKFCTTRTNQNGVATMPFRPDDEYLPNVGSRVLQDGFAQADAYPQVAAHNILGAVGEGLGFTKYAFVDWLISYHRPPGYRVNLPAQTYGIPGPGTVTWATQNLEVCLAPTSRDVPHPLRPYWRAPLAPGSPIPKPGSGDAPLGFEGSLSGKPVPSENHPSQWWGNLKETVKALGHTLTTDWTPLAIPIGFDTTKQFSDNNVKSRALWSFTSPTMHANITLTYEVPYGKTHTFDVPITKAQNCPS